ncbi:MAG: glutamate--tRNA ligase family protein [Saprospiraceae bacterium]
MSVAEHFRSRIAPTPSGLLHPGNGTSFVITWALARAYSGTLLLRIDDLDRARYRREYVEDIFQTLEWLGIDIDEGPSGVEDFERNWSQHIRLPRYHAALNQLKADGHLFACRCTRKQLSHAADSGVYPGHCTHLHLPFEEEDTAWRVYPDTGDGSLSMRVWPQGEILLPYPADSFVVRQKNGYPAYQIASLVDDTHFGITHIVRGEDLLPSTAAQLYLANLMKNTTFPATVFLHHPLIKDANGQKLSKSKGAGSIQALRHQGATPLLLYQQAATLLGLPATINDPQELVENVVQRDYLQL